MAAHILRGATLLITHTHTHKQSAVPAMLCLQTVKECSDMANELAMFEVMYGAALHLNT